ncbi:MAG: hypothetical protein LAN62_02100 [Acidobacteriia bacterium]|nr:hypothetical protein [Terriglobia bacterium]
MHRLIVDLANVKDDEANWNKFLETYGKHFYSARSNALDYSEITKFRNCLRGIFQARELRTKEWLFHTFQSKAYELGHPGVPILTWDDFLHRTQGGIRLPPRSYLERVASELGRKLFHLRCCPNPQCKSPYFIADHGNQKFCSQGCAKPFRLEANRRSWKRHGNEWRRKRKEKLLSGGE